MAESQVPFEYEENKVDIVASLTNQRLSSYLKLSGHDYDYAFALYLYNARLSKAFLFPLHVVEVTLRNRVSKLFESLYGVEWPHEIKFRSLLTDLSLSALDKGIERAKSPHVNDIVATLTFDFWSNLFRSEYDRDLWQTNMNVIAPSKSVSRSEFQDFVKEINKFRNRIAHYEPIILRDVSKMYDTIRQATNLMCRKTAAWMTHFSTVNEIIRTKPSGKGELPPFFKDRADKNFRVVSIEDNLATIPTNQFIVCYEDGEPKNVLTAKHFATFLQSKIEAPGELIIDLQSVTYRNLIDSGVAQESLVFVSDNESFNKASALFKKKGVGFILVTRGSDLIGVIQKSHRRY